MATPVALTQPTIQQRLDLIRTRTTRVAADEFNASNDWRTLPQRLERLCHVLENWTAQHGSPDLSYALSDDPAESRRIALTASIMVSAPPTFYTDFESLFRALLMNRMNQNTGFDVPNEQGLFYCLQTLGWVRPKGLLERPLCQAVRHVIQQTVQDSIQGDFESPGLFASILVDCQQVAAWLADVLTRPIFDKHQWEKELHAAAAHCFCQTRLEEIFELVAEYPDSHTAVLQLKELLEQTGMHADLGQALLACQKRLNHTGASTAQIIDVYINIIQVLRIMDPTDRLLRLVAEPVRTYLRGRKDTVRSIITSLTEQGGDLYQELRREDAKPLEQVHADSDDEEEGPPGMDWQPPPSIFQPRGTFLEASMPSAANGSSGDLLAMLVSIYGSKELFVNEYRLMLADKLLANLDYNTDKEVHTLELLKLRFGEMSMRNCEVMIKDMDDSKRTNAHIREELQNVPTRSGLAADQKPVVDAAIVSHIFWPTLQKDSLKHHPRIQADIDEFSCVYGRLKNPRKLVWMNQLGTVQLELDVMETGLDGMPTVETREFTCSPLLATLILHFEDRTKWSALDLSNETGIPEHVIQKRMTYWINQGVVVRIVPLTTNKVEYELASSRGTKSCTSMLEQEDEDDGSQGQAVSATAHQEEQMEMFESYIVGMLTNLGQLPLERIHNMLKMFVTGSDVRYDKTPQQLSVFLQQLCRQEKLECGPDGMYRLFQK